MPAGHRVELAGGWGLWKWARLRGAGFAANGVLRLAQPSAAAAADRLIDLEAAAAARRLEVQRTLRDAQRSATGPAGTLLGRALKRVRSRRPAEAIESAQDHAASIAPLIELEGDLVLAQTAFESACAHAVEETSTALRDVVRDPRFHEAVLWQNRHAMQTGCAALLRHPNDTTAKARKAERLVASYLQRYCTKNDTIGFFGPNGWANVDPSIEEIVVRPGPRLLASRAVYFEYWAIDALAMVIATHPELEPYLVPRRNPEHGLSGETLHHPVGRETALPPVFAAMLRACDGERPAHAIAELVLADRALELDEPDEVYELLATMVERSLISWTIEVPPATARPEAHLAQLLDRAGPAGARGRAMLDELERCRLEVARAAGDPEALDRALGTIAETFERLTGSAATRGHGQTYAARTIVYEDCRRDLEVVLGAQFQRKLGPPLALVLQSARWFTYQIATRYERALRAIFDEIGPSDYVTFWQRARTLFPGRTADGFVAEVTRELHARWDRILGTADVLVERTVEELRTGVEREFAAPHPGWPSARHHSPDLLICARDEQALRDGNYLLVLGEVHVGMNTACVQVALEQHTDPAVLIAARELDLPDPGIAPVWSKAKTRADFYSQSRRDFDLEVGDTRSARPRDHVLALGELVIEEREGVLIVRPRGEGPSFELIPFLEQHLIAESFSQFEIVGPRPHSPRVVVDGVVFARERWRFARGQLDLANERTPARRFLAIRRWARDLGLPRHIFVKTDAEVKPIFVDLDSPVLVEILAGSIDRSQTFAVTEMLPGLDESWLSDAEQSTYTSELRVVMTDPEPWKSRGRS